VHGEMSGDTAVMSKTAWKEPEKLVLVVDSKLRRDAMRLRRMTLKMAKSSGN
jgi:hypothetical protein